jgi:hypothetical protein
VRATRTLAPEPTGLPEPTEAPTYTPVPTEIAARIGTPQAVQPIQPFSDSTIDAALLPKFGAFPPKAIPARPANINPLTGLEVDPAVLQKRPLVARIGNDQPVRTGVLHAGLNAADLVFEELIDLLGTQYAHTRYSAVYLSNTPPLIGPIRSGRIINFQMVPMLDGALVFSGGSNGTRWLFSQTPMINLDEYYNQPAYCYITIDPTRLPTIIPGNPSALPTPSPTTRPYFGRLYTSGQRIREWLAQKGWEKSVPLYGFNFGDKPGGSQPITSIALNRAPWPSWSALEWRYDAASGTYLRFTGGAPHLEANRSITAKWGNGATCILQGLEQRAQVRATNVVVLWARHQKTSIIEDSNNAVSVYINLTGSGEAQFFRDGVMYRGKWQRTSEQEFFEFVDASGNKYSLKPGNTWFEIVPLGYVIDAK